MTYNFAENRINKTEMIRQVHQNHPAATNKQICVILFEKHGLRVGSNLVIQAIGKEKDRKALMSARPLILMLAKQLLELCGNCRVAAQQHLRMVA